jgi:hypothetical protein
MPARQSSNDDLADLILQLRTLTPSARAAVERLLDDHDPRQSRDHFLPFVRKVWPEFVYGGHHRIMADVFERIDRGEN